MKFEIHFFLEHELEKVLLDVLKLVDRLNDEEGEVRVFLIFPLPVLERLHVSLFVHILATLPQLLVVDNVDVGALFSMVLHLPRVVFEASDY